MKKVLTLMLGSLLMAACSENEVHPPEFYNCRFTVPETGAHPNASQYQDILDRNQSLGLIGVSVMVRDAQGLWLGSTGMADVASGARVQACQQFLIASISKVFTASVIFKLEEEGILSLDDPVSRWLDADILNKVANADQALIRDLLSHLAGIPDYYTLGYDMDRLNVEYNSWSHEEILDYARGQKANNRVGEAYWYSNTHYLLLGMIAEEASGKKLEELYPGYIFDPLELESGYFGSDLPIPEGNVKGYVDIYGDGDFVESEFLYKDELNTADGGIACNAYDTGLFFEKLMRGELLSQASLEQMTDWFPIPEDWYGTFGNTENGYGIERFDTEYGKAVGHTGAIHGFFSVAQYFPDLDATLVIQVNSSSYEMGPVENLYEECLDLMFSN